MIQRNADDKPSPGGLAELERQEEVLRDRLRDHPPSVYIHDMAAYPSPYQ